MNRLKNITTKQNSNPSFLVFYLKVYDFKTPFFLTNMTISQLLNGF